MLAWPPTREELIDEQPRLVALGPVAWRFSLEAQIGGVFVCFARGKSGPGQAGDPAWAAACIGRATTVVPGHAREPYEPGLLALREGELPEAAVRALPELPDVLLILADPASRRTSARCSNSRPSGSCTARSSPKASGRPKSAGARSPLVLGDELVGYWLRTRAGTRPLGRPRGLADRPRHGRGRRPLHLPCPHTRAAAESASASPRGTRDGQRR